MAKITKNDVTHLASLGKLSLSAEGTESLQKDLETILGYIDQLSTLDTKGVEPTRQVNGLANVWRGDTLGDKAVPRETLVGLAPGQQANQIKVPKVL